MKIHTEYRLVFDQREEPIDDVRPIALRNGGRYTSRAGMMATHPQFAPGYLFSDLAAAEKTVKEFKEWKEQQKIPILSRNS